VVLASRDRAPLPLLLPRISPQCEQVNRHNDLAVAVTRFYLCALLLLLCSAAVDSTAQVPGASSEQLLHGSIFTAQGQPAAAVTVEMRDLRGIKVASGVTDSTGNFEISGSAEPGEYVFVALREFEIRDEAIRLDRPGLEVNLALPADPAIGVRAPAPYTVSAKQLRIAPNAWKHLAAANREFGKMNFDRASREVGRALRADPACAPAFSMRALIKLAEKDPRAAVEDARRAVLLDPDDAESFVVLAMSYNSLGEFHKAEEAGEQALRRHPDSWQGRLELATSYYGEGDFIRALCELDSANIDFPDAHLVRGNVLVHLGRDQEAREEFAAFLREAPHDPRADQIHRIAALRPAPNRGANPVGR
jgi:Tfp pilus assembly protein PilF